MRRCETLVASRDNLLAQRDKIRKSVQKEQDAINHFKEEQNARILELRQVVGNLAMFFFVKNEEEFFFDIPNFVQ